MRNVVNFGKKVDGATYLQNILEDLNREVSQKQDFTIHPLDVRMNSQGQLVSRDRETLTHHVTDWALGQLASKTESGLPIRYLRKCPPELQAVNVNHWLQQFDYEKHNPWLFRTHTAQSFKGGMVRGILSEKYSPFDDHEIMDILNQFFGSSDANIDIKMWHRDDTGFHLRVVFDDLTTSVGKLDDGTPDIHKVGLHIENSEVGKKSLKITPLVWRLVCSNGMMGWGLNTDVGMFNQRHIHLRPHEMYGRVAEAIGNALKVGDSALEKILQAKETPVSNPLDLIKSLSEKSKYSKEFTEKVQGAFMTEEGATAFHVVQAFTRACQELKADDRVGVESDASKFLNNLIKAGA